jgi:superfamily I DNA/RNA helicase
VERKRPVNLSHEQLAAVHATEKHVIVASVAGSGKSRVIVERIRYVISQGTDPQRICMVTFTVTAAKEIQNRLGDVRLGYAGTLHGLLLKAIRHSPHLVGYSTQPSVLNEEAAETMLEEAAKESRWTGSLEELRKAAARTIRKKGALSKLEAAAVHYQQKLVDAGLVDYDGILRLGLEMAYSEEFPFKFDHLLVDESQDSAAIDFEIYDAMGVENTFFCGDFAQRIYSFRGSSDGFEKLCQSKDATLYKLQDCYRCSLEVCSAANNLTNHLPANLGQKNISVIGAQGPVVVASYSTAQEELAGLAAKLAERNGIGLCSFNDSAVLLRTNALVDFFRNGLRAAGIPVKAHKSGGKPKGWPQAQAIVSLCGSPANDRLALGYISAAFSGSDAAKAKSKAAQQMGSIYEACPELFADLGNPFKMMTLARVPEEAIAKAEALRDALPEGSDWSDLAMAMLKDEPDKEVGEGVAVKTIHGAKGMEWQAVFLPAFEQQVIPARRELDEETRISYVAFTRAKVFLDISYCAERANTYTRKVEKCDPSEFIRKAGL